MTELPRGWAKANLGELVEVIRGVSYKKNQARTEALEGFVPMLRATNIKDRLVLDADLIYVSEDVVRANQYLRAGDILLAASSGSQAVVGKSAMLKRPWHGTFGAFCAVLRPKGLLDTRYLASFVRSPGVRRRWSRLAAGTNINNLKREHVETTVVPVPPLAEQRRIVIAIDEHISHLEAANQSLHVVRRKLVAQWMSTLLHVFSHVGNCRQAPIEDVLISNIGGVWGTEANSNDVNVAVFRVTEFLADGALDPTTAAVRSISYSQLASRQLQAGDLLLEKSGGGPDQPVGRVAYVPDNAGPAVCSNFVQLLRVDADLADSRYVLYWLMRRYLDGTVTKYQTASTNIRNIKTKEYLRLPIPLPPIEQQHAIASTLDAALTRVQAVRAAIDVALHRSASLRGSILEHAFTGKLVPRDPSDEPASALLERIAGERASVNRHRAPPSRRRRTIGAK